MLNFLWASPTLSPRKTSAFVVSVSLSSAVYCAGDIVQGTIELSCDDETDAVSRLDLGFRTREYIVAYFDSLKSCIH